MQVADRFHLHQNLLEAVKKALNREFPADIEIPKTLEGDDKKTPSPMDKSLQKEEKRYQLIVQIQKYHQEGCSSREIGRRLGVSRNTVAKFISGDPETLS